jgi:hypothetical protein
MKDLIYHAECLTTFLCDDIIELSELSQINDSIDLNKTEISKEFIIPKENEEWCMIEKMLYKELLSHLTHYKNQLILLNTNEGNSMIEQLTKKLYTKDFKITHLKTLNRFNVISYFFCLYDTININHIQYNDVKGKLFLFPEEYIVFNKNVGIYGQLCYENVV